MEIIPSPITAPPAETGDPVLSGYRSVSSRRVDNTTQWVSKIEQKNWKHTNPMVQTDLLPQRGRLTPNASGSESTPGLWNQKR